MRANSGHDDPRGKGRWRLALILASIALAFFAGIIAKVWLFGHG